MQVQETQDLLDARPTDSLDQSLIKAKASLHNCLLLQETLWSQKSRIGWLKEGDRNTTFCPTTTKSKGVVNHIDRILLDGSWVDDQKGIQSLAVNHFSSVANTTHMDPSDFLFGLGSNKVSADMNLQLTTLLDANEIRSAVFAPKKDSSPSPDGFLGYFFTASWQIIGPSVVKAILHFPISGNFYKALNAYFITLIPKSQSPSSFLDYMHISLLNFSYKIIAKILASRLGKIIHHPISPN